MILGLRAHDFGRHEPEELVKRISDAGFETAQLALLKAISGIECFEDINERVLERVRRAFENRSITIGVLGCYMEIGLTDKEARLAEVAKFLLGIEHGVAVGADLVGTETSWFVPEDESKREPAYQGLKDSVLRMVERAEKLEIDIGVEPVAVHTMNSAQITRRLLDEIGSKRLRVIFDPINLIKTQEDIDNQLMLINHFLDILGDDIAAVHIKDIIIEDGEIIWRNIGKGAIDFTPIFSWFRDKGRSIPIMREEVNPESYQVDIDEMRRLNQCH